MALIDVVGGAGNVLFGTVGDVVRGVGDNFTANADMKQANAEMQHANAAVAQAYATAQIAEAEAKRKRDANLIMYGSLAFIVMVIVVAVLLKG